MSFQERIPKLQRTSKGLAHESHLPSDRLGWLHGSPHVCMRFAANEHSLDIERMSRDHPSSAPSSLCEPLPKLFWYALSRNPTSWWQRVKQTDRQDFIVHGWYCHHWDWYMSFHIWTWQCAMNTSKPEGANALRQKGTTFYKFFRWCDSTSSSFNQHASNNQTKYQRAPAQLPASGPSSLAPGQNASGWYKSFQLNELNHQICKPQSSHASSSSHGCNPLVRPWTNFTRKID